MPLRDIPESDWKQLRALQDELLEQVCGKALNRIAKSLHKGHRTNHQTYLDLWETLRREDDKIARMFDDLKRSTAYIKLMIWYRHGLINQGTLKHFTPETQQVVEFLANPRS